MALPIAQFWQSSACFSSRNFYASAGLAVKSCIDALTGNSGIKSTEKLHILGRNVAPH